MFYFHNFGGINFAKQQKFLANEQKFVAKVQKYGAEIAKEQNKNMLVRENQRVLNNVFVPGLGA